jgi:hypothetical protein
MGEHTIFFTWMAVALELVGAFIFETRVVLGLGRKPSSRVLASILRYVPRLRAKPWQEVLVAAVLLAVIQILPLSSEGLVGSRLQPDHISGAGGVVAEIVLGLWLWFGTKWDRVDD